MGWGTRLLDSDSNAIVTHLHDGDAACLKACGEGGGAIGSGGGGEQFACGAIDCHLGACGKSAHGDGAALCADEHGLRGDGDDVCLFALMLLGAGYLAEGESSYIGVFILLLGGVGGDGVGGDKGNSRFFKLT